MASIMHTNLRQVKFLNNGIEIELKISWDELREHEEITAEK